MPDINKLIYILDKLNIKYADYYRPDGSADIQICNRDGEVIGVVWFDADGNLQACDIPADC
jgi:hypothetical protein